MADPTRICLVRITPPGDVGRYYPVKEVAIERAIDRAVADLQATVTTGSEDIPDRGSIDGLPLDLRAGLIPPHSEVEVFLRIDSRDPFERVGQLSGAFTGSFPSGLVSTTTDSDILMFAGRLDRVEVDGSNAGVNEVRIAAREHGADLVDCSLPPEFLGARRNVLLAEVFGELCGHFGVEPRLSIPNTEPPDLPQITFEPGEPAFEVLLRLASIDGLLIFSTPTGLALASAGEGPDNFPVKITQETCKAFGWTRQTQERFAEIEVVGQAAGSSFDGLLQSASGVVVVRDGGGGPATRRMTIRMETGGAGDARQRRAEWELATRVARSETLAVTLPGWLMDADSETNSILRPWPLNRKATVRLPALGLDSSLLIAGIRNALDDGGFSSELTLIRPQALLPQPVVIEQSPYGLFGGDE